MLASSVVSYKETISRDPRRCIHHSFTHSFIRSRNEYEQASTLCQTLGKRLEMILTKRFCLRERTFQSLKETSNN